MGVVGGVLVDCLLFFVWPLAGGGVDLDAPDGAVSFASFLAPKLWGRCTSLVHEGPFRAQRSGSMRKIGV